MVQNKSKSLGDISVASLTKRDREKRQRRVRYKIIKVPIKTSSGARDGFGVRTCVKYDERLGSFMT